MSRLIRFHESVLVMPMKLFGTVEHYALMSAFKTVLIDDTARFDKRHKDVHRLSILDTHGPLMLTVPITHKSADVDEKYGKLNWYDIGISTHGQWWNVHSVSLASAYGRTPFYEFYIDRLSHFFDQNTPKRFNSVAELVKASDEAIRAILGLETKVIYASEDDFDKYTVTNKNYNDLIGMIEPKEYYQVRQDKLGFRPSMSVLDLIFNLGPEAPLHFASMTQKLK